MVRLTKSNIQAGVWSVMQAFKFYFIQLCFKGSDLLYSQVQSQLKIDGTLEGSEIIHCMSLALVRS